MFCSNCGKELTENTNFCPQCGKPQKTNVPIEEPKLEYCEIDWCWSSLLLGINYKFQFIAKAIGPSGQYITDKTHEMPMSESGWITTVSEIHESTAGISNGLRNLIAKLTSDGWEPVGKGQYWFNYKFRRRAK
jgi:hypothetical protein